MIEPSPPFQGIPDDFAGFVDDIATMVVNKLGAEVLKPTYIAVNGTEQPRVVLDIDCALLNSEVLAALRARNLIASDGNSVHDISLEKMPDYSRQTAPRESSI